MLSSSSTARAISAFGRLRTQPEGDVVAHGHVLERRVVLEDEADAALLRRHAGDVLALDPTMPPSGTSRPAMTRSSVDLPEPDGPSSAVSEPSGISSETSSSAWKSPKRSNAVARSCVASFLPWLEERHREQRRQRDEREQRRCRVGAGQVEVLEALLDEQRQRLGLAGDLAADDADRAELADRARSGQHDAVGDAPADRRQRDAPERLPAEAPSVAAACSCSSPISRSTGATSRTTNGRETKIVASTMPGTREDDLDAGVGRASRRRP